MAVVIVATVGSASANSYTTLAEANSYMEGRLNSTLWDAASDDSCNRALVEATREIDTLFFVGKRASTTQALAWPRDFAVDPDDPNGDYFATTEIPTRVKNACMELANQFIVAGTTDVAALDSAQGIVREKVDVIEVEYAPYAKASGLSRYPRVLNWLVPLLDGGVPGGLVTQVVRG